MGRGSKAKRISQLRLDKARMHFGLLPLYAPRRSWTASLNKRLVAELNHQPKPREYQWNLAGSYVYCDSPKIDCSYIPVSDKYAKLVVHAQSDRASESDLSSKIPEAEVKIEEKRINLGADIERPEFPNEEGVVKRNVEQIIKPLLDYLKSGNSK